MADPTKEPGRPRVVAALGISQTLSWGSSYYLPAILSVPMARELAIPPTWVFAAFAMALVVAGILGPPVGRQIDVNGGRSVLAWSSVVLAAGLVLLGTAGGIPSLVVAWLVLGVGMAMGLYEAAFATLVAIYRQGSRGPITGITLIAGFASTVGWPITAALEAAYGWRTACFVWAAINLLICLPLSLFLLPRQVQAPLAAEPAGEAVTADVDQSPAHRRAMCCWRLRLRSPRSCRVRWQPTCRTYCGSSARRRRRPLLQRPSSGRLRSRPDWSSSA